MKKIITLLLIALTVSAFSSFAQIGTACNAEFNFSVAVNNVQFTPVVLNTPASFQHQWQFGDASASSNLVIPTHQYPGPGVYMVMHLIQYRSPNDSNLVVCADSFTRVVTIVDLPPCNLHSNFSFVRDSVQTNKVYFNNLSTGTTPNTIVKWYFGDGTFSYDDSPAHIYATPGAYTVCLLVRRDSICADDTCKIVQVQLPSNTCNLVAGFDSRIDSLNPLTVHFTNHSTPFDPTDSVRYTFGDGYSSNDINPSHTYTGAGSYNVCIRVKKVTLPGNAPCVREFCRTVIVQLPVPCNLHSNFYFVRDSIQINKVHFGNLSDGITPNTIVKWYFGDGTFSYDYNPTHIYTASGTYTVCLFLRRDSLCADDTCSIVQVQVPANACNLHSSFSFVRDSVQSNKVYFSNLSTGTTSNAIVKWNFGDGTFSYDNNPAHIYTTSGAYTVCLLVRRDSLCADDTCKIVQVQVPTNNCNLVAGFDSRPDSLNPLSIHFTNHSIPFDATDSIRYTFGDGHSSNDINPTHTYTDTGTYNVCIRVKKVTLPGVAPCVREFCRVIPVPVPGCNLVAHFSSFPDSVNSRTVHFTNLSTPLNTTDSVTWFFGDGNSSNGQNPTHTYTSSASVFTVCLRVKKITQPGVATCVSEFCQAITIQPVCNLTAYFAMRTDSLNPRVIQFTNLSTPLASTDSVKWTFGDGTSSLDQNPSHTYNDTGYYTVCLRVKKASQQGVPACVSEYCKTVFIQQPAACNLSVDFSTRSDSANRRKIFFTNLSNAQPGQAIANWTFGDGHVGNSWNADHIYTQPGQYTVCLKVSLNNTCIKDTCKMITVLASPQDSCSIQVGFVTRVDSVNIRKVYFINTTAPLNSAAVATWSFGDGMAGTGWNADHIYAQPGRYAVCLTVRRGNDCTKVWCDSVFVPGSTVPPAHCDTAFLEYFYRRDVYMPNELFFFAVANGPVLQQSWTFTRLPNGVPVTVNQNNPVHVFGDTGIYRVCLNGVLWGNCTKEYCDTVNIYSTATPSQCMLQPYPNPAHNQLSVNMQLQQPELITASVYSVQNVLLLQQVQQGFTGNNLVTINIPNLVPGYYTIRLVHGNQVCYARFQKL